MQIDRQDIFNRVVEHARKQNSKAISIYDQCRYRIGEPPKKCFIGCLIPDEKYDPSMEGLSAINDRILSVIFDTTKIDELDKLFLLRLQKIHDDYIVSYWDDEFKNFSKNYNLIMPI